MGLHLESPALCRVSWRHALGAALLIAAFRASLARVSVARDGDNFLGDVDDDTSTCDGPDASGGCARQPAGRALLQQAHGGIAIHHAFSSRSTVGSASPAFVVGEPPHLTLLNDRKAHTIARFAEVDRRFRSLQTSGQAPPMGIASWVNSQLLPLAKATKQEMQTEIDKAEQNVHACGDALAEVHQGISQEETTLSIGEARVNECNLLKEQKSSTAAADCAKVQNFVDSIQGPEDNATVTSSSATGGGGASGSATIASNGDIEHMLKANYDFFQEVHPQFAQLDQTCSDSTSLLQQQSQACAQDIAGIEASFCSLKDAREQACSENDQCFAQQSVLLTRIISDIQLLEAHTKDNFKSLSCLGQTLLQGMPGSAPDCDPESIDVTHLDVSYPSDPTKHSCVGSVTSNWDYSHVHCGPDEADSTTAAGETVSAGVTAAATTGTTLPAAAAAAGGQATTTAAPNASAASA